MTAIDTKRLREELATTAPNFIANKETISQLLDELDRQNELLAVAKAALEEVLHCETNAEYRASARVLEDFRLIKQVTQTALKRLGEG